jgi:hypothetical protein
MPSVGTHLMIVNLTEGNKERQEDGQREQLIEDRSQPITSLIKCWHQVEREIAHRSHRYGNRQCPLLEKTNYLFTFFHYRVQKYKINRYPA